MPCADAHACPMHYALHPTPYILHPTPYTQNALPYTLHPTPKMLCPIPYTLHPKCSALYPTPYTQNAIPYTLHPTPKMLCPIPYTLHPTPQILVPGPWTLETRHQNPKTGIARPKPIKVRKLRHHNLQAPRAFSGRRGGRREGGRGDIRALREARGEAGCLGEAAYGGGEERS
jgi:hypothetical protein